MQTQLANWNNQVSSLLSKSRVVTENLYKAPTQNGYADWPLSKEGADLCALVEKTFVSTIALWNTPAACAWGVDDLVAQALTTQSVIEAMTCDYMYRTNNAPPSGPLWDYLEQAIDMPAAWNMLHSAFDARCHLYPDSVDRVRRALALTAMCRPNVPYALDDAPRHQTIWRDAKELNYFWGRQEDPVAAKHSSLVHGIEAFPSTIGDFYVYASSAPIPDASVQYAFENFTPTQDPFRVDSASDFTMESWCGWLATLQNRPIQWADASARWPEITSAVQIISALEEPSQVGPRVWELQRQQHDKPLEIAPIEASALFGQQGVF